MEIKIKSNEDLYSESEWKQLKPLFRKFIDSECKEAKYKLTSGVEITFEVN